jgi:hypothetical protein
MFVLTAIFYYLLPSGRSFKTSLVHIIGMAERTRSIDSVTQAAQEAEEGSTRCSQDDTAIPSAEDLLVPFEEDTISLPPETTTGTVKAEDYQEDLIDYDDDDLEPAITEVEFNESEIESTEVAPEQQAALHIEQAKVGMAWSISTMLSNTPEIASALQLTSIGASASTEVTVAGVTYEVTWKVVGIEGVQTPTTDIAAPPTPSASTTKCKFGRHCTKGASCPFDHGTKTKLCIWVNTLGGCSNGSVCAHSHEHAGTMCTRSKYRSNCANGKACAYQHLDDVYRSGAMKVKKIEVGDERKERVDGEEAVDEGERTPPANAPTGPKLGKGVGQKRGREDGDGVGGRPGQIPRGNQRGRGRGRGSGRGRGRGRGGVARRARYREH